MGPLLKELVENFLVWCLILILSGPNCPTQFQSKRVKLNLGEYKYNGGCYVHIMVNK